MRLVNFISNRGLFQNLIYKTGGSILKASKISVSDLNCWFTRKGILEKLSLQKSLQFSKSRGQIKVLSGIRINGF